MVRKIALLDSDPSRRTSVFRDLHGGDLHIEPFADYEEFERYADRFMACIVADGDDWHQIFSNPKGPKICTKLKILVYAETAEVRRVVAAMRHGAASYLLCPIEINAVNDALSYPKIHAAVYERKQRLTAATIKETELAHQLVKGIPLDEIAAALKISRRTVETHRANLRRKIMSELVSPQIAQACEDESSVNNLS